MDGQLQVMEQTLKDAKASSEQVNKLIAANEKLAEAANSQSETAKRQVEAIVQSVDAAKRSARAAEENTRLTRQTLLYSQRAYIVPILGRFEPMAYGQKAKFTLTLENTGNTPAIDFKSWAYLKLLDTSQPYPTPVKPEKMSDNVTILGPHGRIQINLTSDFEIDQSTAELIRLKKQRIYVLGLVHYKDVLGESHELPICGYHTGEGNNAAICTKEEKQTN
jgi:hypothetical protein